MLLEMAVLGRHLLAKDFVFLPEKTCGLHEAGHREHRTAAATTLGWLNTASHLSMGWAAQHSDLFQRPGSASCSGPGNTRRRRGAVTWPKALGCQLPLRAAARIALAMAAAGMSVTSMMGRPAHSGQQATVMAAVLVWAA